MIKSKYQGQTYWSLMEKSNEIHIHNGSIDINEKDTFIQRELIKKILKQIVYVIYDLTLMNCFISFNDFKHPIHQTIFTLKMVLIYLSQTNSKIID